MTYTKLDDNFDTSPKLCDAIDDVGDSAGWMWVRAVNHCNKHLTDGFVRRSVVPSFTKHRKPFEVAAALVKHGLFEETERGYQIHDFLVWNDSREKVHAARAAVKARKEAWLERRRGETGTPPPGGGGTRPENASGTRSESVPPTREERVDGTPPSPLLSTPLHSSDQRSDPCPPGGGPVREVFAYWQSVMATPKAKLDGKRERAIRNALESFSVEDLKLAIDGCRADPFSMGENDRHTKFNDIELICRNAPSTERFMSKAPSPPESPPEPLPPPPMRPEVAAILAQTPPPDANGNGQDLFAGLVGGIGNMPGSRT